MSPALIAGLVFVVVFLGSWALLWRVWKPRETPKPRPRSVGRPSLGVLPIFGLGDMAWIVFLFVIGLLAVWGVASLLQPLLRRRWPRLVAFVSSWLPLPCLHTDASGQSLTYRERRTLDGHDVVHWVCSHCGAAEPLVARTASEHAAAVAVGERALASPRAIPMVQPKKVVNGGFAGRGK